MNFAVMEISDKTKFIVDFVPSIDMFIYKLKEIYPSANYINYVLPKDIEKHDYFSSGLYILTDNNTISLLEKSVALEKGFFYNTKIKGIEIKKHWECIEIISKEKNL